MEALPWLDSISDLSTRVGSGCGSSSCLIPELHHLEAAITTSTQNRALLFAWAGGLYGCMQPCQDYPVQANDRFTGPSL